MDVQGIHQEVEEFRSTIGPKFDMLIKLGEDSDELSFDEDLVVSTCPRIG